MFTFIRIALYVIVALFSLPSYSVFYATLTHLDRGERIFLSLILCLAIYLVSMWLIQYSLIWKPNRKPFETFQTVVSLVGVAVVLFINLYLGWKLYNGDSLTPSEASYAKGVMLSAVVVMTVFRLVFSLRSEKPKESKE